MPGTGTAKMYFGSDLVCCTCAGGAVWCVCTVPNFNWESHVRFFRSSEEVRGRYGELIDIEAVIRVARPVMPGGDVRRYLRRNLRWSRNDPSELLGFLGIQRFERLGGWFLFCGIKKH